MAVTASFDPTSGLLSVFGDDLANAITLSREPPGPFWSTAARCR